MEIFDRYYAYCVAELRERVWEKYTEEPNSGCWLWTGHVSPYGYGQISFLGRPYPAHRLVYELERGSIPAGLTIDHLCRNRQCVNPDHLEPVTGAENTRRGRGGERTRIRQLSKMLCKRGHPLDDPSNIIISKSNGQRICLACRLIRKRAYNAKIPKKGPNLEGLKLGGKANGERNKAKTHCPHGHPYSGDNLGFQKDSTGRVIGRACRACHANREKVRQRKLSRWKSTSTV